MNDNMKNVMALRAVGKAMSECPVDVPRTLTASEWSTFQLAAADLLQCHEETGLDLHTPDFLPVRAFVEFMLGGQKVVATGDHPDERLPKPSPLDHRECSGWDNQEWYWNCYTHDLFRQEWV